MKRWAHIFTLSLCFALFAGGGFTMSGFDVGHAWADDDGNHDSASASDSGSESTSSDSDRDYGHESDYTSRSKKYETEDRGEQNKLGAVRDAVASSKILPLSKLKAIVIAQFGSNIVDIEIEQEKGLWIYEFKIINNSGRLVEVYMNAENGRILKIEND